VRYLFRAIFLPKYAVRMVNRRSSRKVAQHAIPPRWVNRALRACCTFEDRLLRGVPVPFGTSVLAVARRPG
jgi:hypothetical protein